MIYPFSLQAVGIIVGLALIATHLFALLTPTVTKPFLRQFPRSRPIGTVLLAIAAIWAYWLISTMDLGEFARLRHILQIAIPVGAVLTWYFVDEFLAVRCLGILALLAAAIPIEAAFLRPELSRLFLVLLAYAWVLIGLFLVGMPYLLRDLLDGITTRPKLFTRTAGAGIAYGILLLACAIVLW